MPKYTVSLYDKDNDYFRDILSTDSLDKAKEVQGIINLVISADDIVVRRNDTEFGRTYKEPFDEVQIWNTETNKIVTE